jgi:hypothetical protein
MDESVSHADTERHTLVGKYLSEVSLFAKGICPEAKVEATMERYEDEDGHVRIYPPAGLSKQQIEELEGKIAERCVDILVETGVFLCSAVYEPDK